MKRFIVPAAAAFALAVSFTAVSTPSHALSLVEPTNLDDRRCARVYAIYERLSLKAFDLINDEVFRIEESELTPRQERRKARIEVRLQRISERIDQRVFPRVERHCEFG